MKRMICALLAVALLLGLAGCKKDTENQLEESQMTLEAETTEETAEETTEEITEETVEETETTEETEATVVPCAEHTWGEWVRWEKPSTTTEGKRVRTCVVCGEEDVEIEPTLPKTTNHTHKYKVEKATATCLEDGWAYYYCSCGDWYEVPLKATGHKWKSWEFTKIPTDTAKGLKVRVCESCKTREEEQTPSFQEHTHKYYEFKNEPTCTKAGAKGKICSVCGYSESTKIAALGHDWGSWKETKKATETAKGVETRTCKRCKTKKTRSIDKLPHTTHRWETKEVVAATCTEEGYTVQKCKDCTAERQTDVVLALGHQFVWETDKEPTCVEEGTETERCNRCSDTGSSRTLDPLGHDWGDWETNQEDTTKEIRTCSRCRDTETRDANKDTGENTGE